MSFQSANYFLYYMLRQYQIIIRISAEAQIITIFLYKSVAYKCFTCFMDLFLFIILQTDIDNMKV